MDQSSRDDTLVDAEPPGAPPAGAVSSQSSRDERAERSAGESSMRDEGRAISARDLAVDVLVAIGVAAVVLTRYLRRLAVLLSVYGFTLVILFLVFQAPDVALSELVVGAVAFPLVVVVALVLAKERGE